MARLGTSSAEGSVPSRPHLRDSPAGYRGASAARAWGQRYSCTADPSLRPSRLVHPAAINHALGFVERVFLAIARACCNRRTGPSPYLTRIRAPSLRVTFAFQEASAGGSCGEKRIILRIGRLRNPTPDGQSHLRPCGVTPAWPLVVFGTPSRWRVFVTLSCGRLRSKPMLTLTHPENRPCGYAGDMLRITPWTRGGVAHLAHQMKNRSGPRMYVR
jgi:hypothetical protein